LFRTALHDLVSGRGKTLAYAGTALALTGLGTATVAAATSSASPAPGIASAAHHLNVGDAAGQAAGPVTITGHQATAHQSTARRATADEATPRQATPRQATARQTTGPKTTGHQATGPKTTGPKTTGPKTTGSKTTHTAPHAAPKTGAHATPVRHQASRASGPVVRKADSPMSWAQVSQALAAQTYPKAAPGQLPAFDQLQPGPVSGPQAYMPITADRMANATTIVRQALAKHMGLRSAVIAVATAMQESTLVNLHYGDRDSQGLFQQRPSAGWGTPAQVTDPVYAADAFLNALHAHQQADPGWAIQPLWQNAQAVQVSGFPYAYAKWEAQAAQLVSSIARHMA
jgi:hypothetical protein